MPTEVEKLRKLRIWPVALSVGLFLSISFLFDVFLGLIFPDIGFQRIWEVLLPGFRWISLGHFLWGLIASLLLGLYVGIIFVPIYNFFNRRFVLGPENGHQPQRGGD